MLKYTPEIFSSPTLDDAKRIILTPEDGVSTEIRWAEETKWLVEAVSSYVRPGVLALDYGCGVGRVSSKLIDLGAAVVGVDLSYSMRKFAIEQNASEFFSVASPEQYLKYVNSGLKFDLAFSIWVLQHCINPEEIVDLIHSSLNDGGFFIVLDMAFQAIPTNCGWVSTDKSIGDIVGKRFNLVKEFPYNPAHAPENLRKNAWLAIFQK